MSDAPNTPHPLIALRVNYKNAYDAAAMLVYLILLYGWGLWIYPLGRDYEHLANLGEDMPFLARQLFSFEVKTFGANPVGYHLVNISFMYVCMLLLYHFINKSAKGLWWFGTLAASLFMANPVHSETMHNLSGVADLVPCLAGLLALTAYAWNVEQGSKARLGLVLVLACAAAGLYGENAALGLVLIAYELLVVRKESRSVGRGIVIGASAVVTAIVGGHFSNMGEFDLRQMFAPLYLVFYPIGFLPKTVESMHERMWLVWLSIAALFLVIVLIHRKARRPEFIFAILGMMLLRIVPSTREVDLVHMLGGGQLLLPNVLFTLGFIIIMFRIMDHPRWRVPMITITTTLVIIFFLMQWRSLKTWSDAGKYVRDFQAHAREVTQDGEVLGVLPDFRNFKGAPLALSESISFDTPFSKRIDHVSLLPVHRPVLTAPQQWIASWSESGGEVALPKVEEAPRYFYFPHAERITYNESILLKSIWGDAMPEAAISIVPQENGELRVMIEGVNLPKTLLPGNVTRKEANGESKPDTDNQ
ncbi:MAG: hypothetical protein IT367_02565 [Candidatus Hydrogenedentes bacterium]|nr:hypothetical protein [Candidatus Hydrogenedentota bacterium]